MTQQLLTMLGVNYPMGQLKENHGFVARIINPEFGGSALIQGIAFTETVGSSRGAGDAAFVPIVDWVAATNDFPVEYFQHFYFTPAIEGACFCKRCPAQSNYPLAGYCPLCDCELGEKLAAAASCRFWENFRPLFSFGLMMFGGALVLTPLGWGWGGAIIAFGGGVLTNEIFLALENGGMSSCENDQDIMDEEFWKFCASGDYCDKPDDPANTDCPMTCNEDQSGEPW